TRRTRIRCNWVDHWAVAVSDAVCTDRASSEDRFDDHLGEVGQWDQLGDHRWSMSGYFAGVPPSSRTIDSYSADWRISRPATSRRRSTSSGGSTKLVGRFMK